jgi:regulatory protein
MAKPRQRAGAPGPAPDAAALQAAALTYLARYAATQATLRRVLERRVERWANAAQANGADTSAVAQEAAAARRVARDVVARLAASGAIDDAAYAVARGGKLLRAGHSRRAAALDLRARGVDAETARAALPEDADTELAAALALARRRRIGPFRMAAADAAAIRREAGVLARAGFPREIAVCALGMEAAAAEALLLRLRRS